MAIELPVLAQRLRPGLPGSLNREPFLDNATDELFAITRGSRLNHEAVRAICEARIDFRSARYASKKPMKIDHKNNFVEL